MTSAQPIPLYELDDIKSGTIFVNSFTAKEYRSRIITLNYRLTEEFNANATNLFQLVCLYLTQRLRRVKSEQYFDILMDVLEDIVIPQYRIWLQEVGDFEKVKIRVDVDIAEIVECRFLALPYVEISSNSAEKSHIHILSFTDVNVGNVRDDYINAEISSDQGIVNRNVLYRMHLGETANCTEQDDCIQRMFDIFAGKK